MDYIERLQLEIKKGFTKTYLEKQMDLPKNSLASYLSGKKKMTAANEARIIKFLTENPELDILSMPRRTRTPKNPYLNLKDASHYVIEGTQLVKVETPVEATISPNKPITAPKKEKQVNTPQKPKEAKFEPQGAAENGMPVKMEGESGIDYKIRLENWKEQLKNKQ